ncbi:hypothetical protein FisN_13Lh298 [Fistulifera solaris]|uniref:Uncharacterized protein n=1 Tax=Fistulifera solaris TaxID=1519565 RepID=A0A1Z5KLG4_FISSO|nr:hypothetical protein FisN_13Lh298 [Fistulifera solaris]|eukprot:GAX27154.1 hypothetical protein FisN_13Lh298 [Fistulifera solaris]
MEDPQEQFSTQVAAVLMGTEELRRSLTHPEMTTTIPSLEQLMEWPAAIERLHDTLFHKMTHSTPEQHDLYHHCQHRVITVAQQILTAAWQWEEPEVGEEEVVVEEEEETAALLRREGQGAIARLTELNLLLLLHSSTTKNNDWKTSEEIIEGYAAYQKQVLRLRVRPAIATLVEARRDGTIHVSIEETTTNVPIHDDDDDDDDDHDNETKKPPIIRFQQYHAPVLMEVLGEASALIHPLLQWHFSLPPDEFATQIRTLCHNAITVLDEQTQQLIQRISDWFWQDRPMEEWMQNDNDDDKEVHLHELSRLDALVEEMAFSCQLLARYEQMMMPFVANNTSRMILQKELLPEWNWKYAALERIWAVRQWQSALRHATPVAIVLGTEVNVPSVVEDAQYLSTRALERAASTRSLQAIGTVAHAVTHDVWSMEMASGVHQSLLEQRGCWSSQFKKEEDDNETEKINMEKSPNSGFASALLEALDDDIAKAGPPTPKAPSSGSFLSSIVSSLDENMQLMQLDMEFCVMNGLLAASASCRNLVAFLDSLLSEDEFSFLSASEKDKSTTMTHLAREELFRFEQGYRATLKTKIAESIVSWCGSGKHEDACPPNFRGKAMNHLRYFLEHENYQLDPVSFAQPETDDRLERDFLGPLRESVFLKSMANKCDADVLHVLAEQLSTALVELFSESIWECESMFTDCGSLLLSKQFRMIQSFVATVTQPSSERAISPNLFQVWEPLSQIVFVLQLEKPADWQAYQSTSVLSPENLYRTMKKRVDFSPEAVQSVVEQFRRAKEGST